MQISRDSIQMMTPFVFTEDACSCCGEPYGFDVFEIQLPVKIETEIPKQYKWQPDAYKKRTAPLIDEFNELYAKDSSKMGEDELDLVQDRIFDICSELAEIGTFVIPCKYKLKATYEVGPDDAVHCIITYIETEGRFVHDGVLLQSNLNSVEDLAMVFKMVDKGLDVDSLEMNEEDLLEFHHDDSEDDDSLDFLP